jgi:hypothetical protein
MVGLLLGALDVLLASYAAGDTWSAGDMQTLQKQSELWREQLERLKQRLASVTIEPPKRVQ